MLDHPVYIYDAIVQSDQSPTVVIEQPFETPSPEAGTIDSFPAEFFIDRQATNAGEMINLIPGFVFDPGTAARGLIGNSGNVLIDGTQPVLKSDTITQVLSRIPARSVQRIDVIRGGAEGLDMLGKTVVANIILRKETRGQYDITATATVSDEVRLGGTLLLQGKEPIGRSTLEGSVQAARFLNDSAGNGNRDRRLGDGTLVFDSAQTLRIRGDVLKVTGALDSPVFGGNLKLNTSFRTIDFKRDELGILDPGAGIESDFTSRQVRELELGALYKLPIGKWNLEALGLYQSRNIDLDNEFLSDPNAVNITGDAGSADFSLSSRETETVIRLQANGSLSRNISARFGAEGAFNTITNATTFSSDGVSIALPAGNVEVTERRGEVFAELIIELDPRLKLEGGTRLEWSSLESVGQVTSERNFSFFKPRVLLNWTATAKDRFWIEGERSVDQLDFSAFVAQAANINRGVILTGNPTLTPEQSWAAEVGWERRIGSNGSISLTVRHEELQDVVDRIPIVASNGVFDSPGNIGNGRLTELTVNSTLPTDIIGLKSGLLRANATVREARVTDPVTQQNRSISGLAPYEWSVSYTQPLPKLNSEIGFDLERTAANTSFFLRETVEAEIETFLNAYIQHRPSQNLTLRVDALNILGSTNSEVREIFDGTRALNTIQFLETTAIRSPRFIRFRVFYEF